MNPDELSFLAGLCKECNNFPCGKPQGDFCESALKICREAASKGDLRVLELRRELKWKRLLRTRINWGFWVLMGAFTLYLITQYVLRPLLKGG